MAGKFTDADSSNIVNIFNAVYAIADTPISGVTWGSRWQRRMPFATEVSQPGKLPALVVMQPRPIGYFMAGEFQGKRFPMVASTYEKAHDITIYGLWPGLDVTNDLNYTVPEDALGKLERAFVINYSLQQTAVLGRIVDQDVGPFRLGNNEFSLDGAKPFSCCWIKIEASEKIYVNNTPA